MSQQRGADYLRSRIVRDHTKKTVKTSLLEIGLF